MKLTWQKREYSTAPTRYEGFVGRWHCFTVSTRLERKDYIFSCHFPGINDTLFLESIEECREKAKEILKNWVDGLREGEDE